MKKFKKIHFPFKSKRTLTKKRKESVRTKQKYDAQYNIRTKSDCESCECVHQSPDIKNLPLYLQMGPERNGPTHGHVQGVQKIPGGKRRK